MEKIPKSEMTEGETEERKKFLRKQAEYLLKKEKEEKGDIE